MPDLEWLTAHPIAHRGFHDLDAGIVENSLAAFERAAEAGFAIECDVQFPADGVPIVFHDETLDRLCPLGGAVADKLSTDLQQMVLAGTRQRIPTLGQTLDRVAGRVPLVIELKGRRGDDDGLAGAVLEAVETYVGPVALMSFDDWILEELIALEPSVPIGLTAEGNDEKAFSRHRSLMAQGLHFVSYNVDHLPNPFTDGLRKAGIPVVSWTVRNTAGRETSRAHADQMTFEGFDPRADE
ncbi:glycerophosphodiester phosphodiesterase family protein [Pararhizobium mangrovi]|uniref:Glycerophosphodiester phosphodiesterase n=1 Tax=Pararhizobium mangrovi TaxID=2590452 RepID=A0A506UC90_9HYPH|nr:glycerophosphodiester phosphodiesterase family protein [Pararhizobium mangrovi]TPW31208.1 glycerophosphodiester phosphodiesterase [Pararhizobium mangrovi]